MLPVGGRFFFLTLGFVFSSFSWVSWAVAFTGGASWVSAVVSYLLTVEALVVLAVTDSCYCVFMGACRVVVLRVVCPAAYEAFYRVSP